MLSTVMPIGRGAGIAACLLSLSLLGGCEEKGAQGQGDAAQGASADAEEAPLYRQWHTVTLNFAGPETSEQAEDNPFLNYRLDVRFTRDEEEYRVRGYYAADGQAAATGAEQGNVWQVKFNPPAPGRWHYHAELVRGDQIAITPDAQGKPVPLEKPRGQFEAKASDGDGQGFHSLGRLSVKDSYFYFPETKQYWLKGGANGPENFLAYAGFDGTYRIATEKREGEASVDTHLHQYEAHRQDWREGDPTLRGGKGKALFGAINYLADKGMNALYFLTLNIDGDGRDVWPYADPDVFTRFDVSKLAQWEQLFEYMQGRGILLHMVTQETENERLLDDGDVGPMRKLYYLELIARFSHHPALVWNLGEENGYAEWAPPAQDDAQRRAMVEFFERHDPYQHPVLLHTHAEINTRQPVLELLLGVPGLDGLSLQADKREHAADVVTKWKRRSREAGHEWLVTMDEIGMWHTGADIDENDPGHISLRGDVLWGTLLSGAAGVEWYFGAKVPHNDLNSEDWRQRDQLWSLTKHALDFFQAHLPWWEMQPCHDQVSQEGAYCLGKEGEVYALYFPHDTRAFAVDLGGIDANLDVFWYNPEKGGELLTGTAPAVQAEGKITLGQPPSRPGADWVVLLRETN
ncbi:DUF5060 domain-containing protein [Microbulbifer yueqingensis]|uniref:Putative collagen-binding domain of a collagenase n=1 Tax=Microbulbifer yueqingensis TaxID=658219 RepID=A0A1G8V860_9GAMM|nr:DUF5060 domain-containing protein [Microbulbifer yueqingensis]SDJ62203.1 Putative collagen-binding domain of a collagenase [Microbulbifer yueqingensis]